MLYVEENINRYALKLSVTVGERSNFVGNEPALFRSIGSSRSSNSNGYGGSGGGVYFLENGMVCVFDVFIYPGEITPVTQSCR